MIVVIDNYDSFTYSIVQYLRELGAPVFVARNDEITIAEIVKLEPTHLVIAPGPSTPDEAGISLEAIEHFAGKLPILGVSLGHQCIAQVFGGKVIKAQDAALEKTSQVKHDGAGLFEDVPNPFAATYLHTHHVERESLPETLQVIAETADGEIMAIRHREHEVFGMQFHPESILTDGGIAMLANFINLYPVETGDEATTNG